MNSKQDHDIRRKMVWRRGGKDDRLTNVIWWRQLLVLYMQNENVGSPSNGPLHELPCRMSRRPFQLLWHMFLAFSHWIFRPGLSLLLLPLVLLLFFRVESSTCRRSKHSTGWIYLCMYRSHTLLVRSGIALWRHLAFWPPLYFCGTSHSLIHTLTDRLKINLPVSRLVTMSDRSIGQWTSHKYMKLWIENFGELC